MKKFFVLLSGILMLLIFAPKTTLASSSGWFRITTDDVAFYTQATDIPQNQLFLLQKSYYIYGSSQGNGFLQVQLFDNTDGFGKISGFVREADVTPCSLPPVAPFYPKYTLTAKTTNATLKSQATVSSTDVAIAISNQSIQFIGVSPSSENWYLVRFYNDLGYVEKSQLSTLSTVLHPTPLEVIVPPEDDEPVDPEPTDPAENDISNLVMIALVAIPTVIIIAMLFSPSKAKHGKFQKPKYMYETDMFDDLDLI